MAKFGKYNLKTISLRLEENTLERIDAQTSEYENRTDYIRKAILEQLKKDESENA